MIQHYTTLAEFPIEAVLPFVSRFKVKREYRVGDKAFKVKMYSLRLQTFNKSLGCAKCGLEGSKFLLQHEVHNKQSHPSPHFNLYAEKDGELILMTKDHILPKSKGGPDHLSNLQTMCFLCNQEKGNVIQQVG